MPNLKSQYVGKPTYKIATKVNHTVILTPSGKVYTAGCNEYGELGTGDQQNHSAFTQILIDAAINDVEVGRSHTILLSKNGKIYGAGLFSDDYRPRFEGDKEEDGESNHIRSESISVFTPIVTPEKVKVLGAGYYHTLIVGDSGEIYGNGSNEYNQLGLQYHHDIEDFQSIIKLPTLSSILGTYSRTYLLTKTGDVYVSGRRAYDYDFIPGIKDNTCFEKIPFPEPVISLSADLSYMLIVTVTGKLYMIGNLSGETGLDQTTTQVAKDYSSESFDSNDYPPEDYKLSLIPTSSPVRQVCVQKSHCFYLTTEGQLYGFGANYYGVLGLPKSVENPKLYQPRVVRQFTLVPTPGRVVSVASGWDHTIIETEAGHLYGVGSNQYGQLGLKELKEIDTFVPIPLE